MIGSLRLAAATVVIAAASSGCTGAETDLPESFSVVDASEVNEFIAAQKGRVVVLNLWATWCGPCREEFPALARLDREYRDRGVVVIGLTADEPDAVDSLVKPFIAEVDAEFTILVKDYGDPMKFLDELNPRLSGAIPETIIYDREGNEFAVIRGERTFDEFVDAVRGAL